MRLTGLHFAGFKSFADPLDLIIEPGLTAIVGPNGSGKSNIVEGLCWVMGENAPSQLRSAEMEDVIFVGAKNRPKRNVASVSVRLDLPGGGAGLPKPLDTEEILTVSRRIERGLGSRWQVNGITVRGRDVHMLFADRSTGARSSAIISQGAVTSIVTATPLKRRFLLEEAAGISGLSARKKEVEQHLRASQNNLERHHDQLVLVQQQYTDIKRQDRQAARYRHLSEQIRSDSERLWRQRWCDLSLKVETIKQDLDDAKGLEHERSKATQLSASRLASTKDLVVEAQGHVAKIDQDRRISVASIDDIARQITALDGVKRDLKNRGGELEQDLTNASHHRDQSQNRCQQLDQDIEKLTRDIARSKKESQALEAATPKAMTDQLAKLEEAVAKARKRWQDNQWQYHRLEDERDQASKRLESLNDQLVQIETEIQLIQKDLPAEPMDFQRQDFNRLRADLANAEQALVTAQSSYDDSKKRHDLHDRECRALAKESEALEMLYKGDNGANSLAELLDIAPGYEDCVALSLGASLLAPLAMSDGEVDVPVAFSGKQSHFWRSLTPSFSPTPINGVGQYLSDKIDLGEHLAFLQNRLAHIGLVDTEAEGWRLQLTLKPGQSLVSRQGYFWRWDGFCARGDVINPIYKTAKRLEKSRQLLRQEQAYLAALDGPLEQAHQAQIQTQNQVDQLKQQMETASEQMFDLRQRQEVQAKTQARLDLLRDQQQRLTQDSKTASLEYERAGKALDGMELDPEPPVSSSKKIEHLRLQLSSHDQRQQLADKEGQALCDHLAAAEDERKALADQSMDYDRQIKVLQKRCQDNADKIDQLATRPDTLAQQRADLEETKAHLDDQYQQWSKRLADRQDAQHQRREEYHQSNGQQAQSHEEVVRLDEQACHIAEQHDQLAKEITLNFTRSPQDLWPQGDRPGERTVVETDNGGQEMNVTALSERIARIEAKRDALGAVNLDAQRQMETIQTTLEAMEHERDDLGTSIQRLTTAMSKLERQGRKKIQTTFDRLNQTFGDMFKAFFPGGQAAMELVDNDDPLHAGLEIFVRLPGKKRCRLSLLSGGEQTMTGLAISLAAFTINPGPLCVFDEVDAALDEANLAIFCRLIKKLIGDLNVPVIVITHHILTMAQADRLYGVTMAEPGVSRLAVVDFAQAEKLRQAI